MKPIESKTAEDTLALGEAMGRLVSQGLSIALKGDLGAGKTTFVKGFAKGLGVSQNYYITSPTFTLINEYPASPPFTLYHLDLYRLSSADELDYIGFDDLAGDNHILVVEWPEILKDISFEFDIELHFQFDDHYNRSISVFASGQPGLNLLSKLSL